MHDPVRNTTSDQPTTLRSHVKLAPTLTHTRPNSAIPRAVLTIRNLKRLNLTSNQISKLPVQLPHACSSRSSSCLNRAHTLCDTHASFTQATIGQLKQLRQLDLTWNQLTVLPNEIGSLSTQLVSLRHSLTHCSTGYLAHLEVLNVGFNKLVSLPRTIGKLKSLRSLVASDNSVSRVQSTTPATRVIACDECSCVCVVLFQLESLPKDIGNCTALVDVSFQVCVPVPQQAQSQSQSCS